MSGLRSNTEKKPEMGPAGTKVTITGKNFIDAMRVKFGVNRLGRNVVSASFERLNDTTIVATVPDQSETPFVVAASVSLAGKPLQRDG